MSKSQVGMTDSFATDLAADISDLFTDGSDVVAPTSVWVKLHDGDPTSDGTANELDSTSGPGYSAVEVSVPSGFNEGGDTTIFTNANEIGDFGPATGDWNTVSHFSIWTTQDQAGRALYEDALTESKTVTDGDPVVISAGNLTVDMLE